ncbi:uncharacterized protein EI97DRAFT_344513, partial [Westerdykella ornata]
IDEEGHPQVVYYQSGIGTDSWWKSDTLMQAFGIGIDEKIMEAYSFICNNYNRGEDEIYLIGFSRGAFTARCIAHLIHDIGLLTKKGLYFLTEVFFFWKTNRGAVADPIRQNRPKWMSSEYLRSASLLGHLDVRVEICALWDTVSSIGLPSMARRLLPYQPSSLGFVHSDLCPGVEFSYQALSLHERRADFLSIVWKYPDDAKTLRNRLEQCWFMGCHSDIGGGNRDEGLAHFPLIWIISKLRHALDFDDENLWE